MAVLGSLILLTHKMTSQLFWYLCFAATIVTGDLWYLLLIPVSMILALISSTGFYWKILVAHWDILSFWARNWRWLQAHPVKESPIYGDSNYETPTRFYRSGLHGFLKHISYLLAYNPSAWLAVGVMGFKILHNLAAIQPMTFVVFNWLALVLVFALATLFIPGLRALGSGYYYLYNAAFPASLLWGLLILSRSGIAMVGCAVSFGLCSAALAMYYRQSKRTALTRTETDFTKALDSLKREKKGVVMCLPHQWYDIVAYQTGQPVLFGGHGYGFRLLEPIFPRLMIPIAEVVRRYGVRHLLTMEGYLPKNFMEELPYAEEIRFGCYRIYRLSL
jgi:hypothetical protein